MALADLVTEVVGPGLGVAVVAYDGSRSGPEDATSTVVVRSPTAISRILWHPGELGFVRAFVAGDIDVEGDLFDVLTLGFDHPDLTVPAGSLARLVREAGPGVLHRAEPPPEEANLQGRLHTRARDANAVSHHYDVSNDFYRLVLGPSMTYSCALFEDPDRSLEEAQAAKYDLICEKLRLRPGDRLLDVGCGWGSMLIHAATHHGVRGVGITLSRQQAELGAKRVAEAGLGDVLEIRLQDYRDIDDGPFDAISSIGMFEHVGRSQIEQYAKAMYALLRPGGRFLNHAINRPGRPVDDSSLRGRAHAAARRVGIAVGSSRSSRIDSPLMQRYVFPDAELHEVGTVVSMMQEAGFEARHLESLRENYALTLRRWVANLEANWDECSRLAGARRARVWRLYMAACAIGFERNRTQVHQLLLVRPDADRSGFALRPSY